MFWGDSSCCVLKLAASSRNLRTHFLRNTCSLFLSACDKSLQFVKILLPFLPLLHDSPKHLTVTVGTGIHRNENSFKFQSDLNQQSKNNFIYALWKGWLEIFLSTHLSIYVLFWGTKYFSLSLFFFSCCFRATPSAYGDFQARGRIGVVAASLCHSHRNSGS